ncbi:MAG: response regulator [Pirellulales bacterium]
MTRRILLCDDESHILRAAQFKLSRAGYEVDCAGDGEEAWQTIACRCPDLVVTDCQMPRLDGLGLAQRIHGHPDTCHVPVLMLSAKCFELTPEELAAAGILAVLTKPFSPRELLRMVEEVLETGGVETAIPSAVTLA